MDNSEFERGMREATAKLIAIQHERMEKATKFLEGKAVENTPTDTGQLKASMMSRTQLKSDEIYGIVGNTASHAPYVHQGTGVYAVSGNGRKTPWRYKLIDGSWRTTKGQKPQPFLKDAKEKNLGSIMRMLGGK